MAASLVAGCSSSGDGSGDSLSGKKTDSAVVVGSNNFAESNLIADVYGEALKAKGFKVTYRQNIGSRETTYGLLKNGSLTVLPEYSGALLAYLDPKAAPKTVATTMAAITAELDPKLTLLDPAPAQDKDSVTLNAATAEKYHLTARSSIADLKQAAPGLAIGGSPEFQTRQQGLVGLKPVYGLTFKSFNALDTGGALTQAALRNNTIQAADIFTTDPVITKEKFVVLQDPENLFGFENVVPLVYKSGLSQQGVDALDAVSAKLDTATLLALDTQVQSQNKDPLAVARTWLKSAGLA
jgi:osmoprotectant transport system substrate-binding protein